MIHARFVATVTLLVFGLAAALPASGQPPAANPASSQPADGSQKETPPPLAPLPDALTAMLKEKTPLNPEQTVFLDLKQKRVLLRTQVACQECLLEMFLCLEQTKEHESVLWLRSKAFVVHSALLAAGAKPGRPVQFQPEFQPPTGQRINIFVNWVDSDGKLQRCDARKWMRHSVSRYYSAKLKSPPPGVKLPLMELRYDPYNKEVLWYGQMTEQQRDKLLALWNDKTYQQAIQQFYKQSQPRPMTAEFVFAGSYQYQPDESRPRVYAAEGGQIICVANFSSSIMDVCERSSADNGAQSYEADPDAVPPKDTPVIVELVPVFDAAEAESKQ